jgi:hypothetical protein
LKENKMDEAIRQTANQLNCSIAEVEKAIEIYRVYRGHKGREKQKRKQLKAAQLQAFAIQKEKDAHPKRCFCDEEGIEVQRSPDTDDVVRYEPGYNTLLGEIQIPIYKCPNCGKEYHTKIYFA